MNSFYRNFTYSYPDSTLLHSQFHRDLATEAYDLVQVRKALNEQALALCLLGREDSALVIMETLVQMAIEAKDSIELGIMYKNMGSVYGYRHQYQNAIRYYSMSLPIFEHLNRPKDMAGLLNNIGLIYLYLESYDLALDYIRRSADLYKEWGDSGDLGTTYVNMGHIYLAQGKPQEALTLGRKALLHYAEENSSILVAGCYHLMGSAYKEMSSPDSAAHFLNKSLDIRDKIGNDEEVANTLLALAELKFPADVTGSIAMAQTALEKALSESDWRLKANAFELLYQCYKLNGQTDKSLEMLEQSKICLDSAHARENNIAVVREAIRTEFELKMQENEQASQQVTSQLEREQKAHILLLTGIGLVTLVLIALFAYWRIRSHRRQATLLLEEVQKLKADASKQAALPVTEFSLNRGAIEQGVGKKLNETDWKVLNILLEDPVISNKDLADVACLSVDGIGSSLRRMYVTFEVKESRYMKISLIMEAIKLSNRAHS